jgi:hypothetical protein
MSDLIPPRTIATSVALLLALSQPACNGSLKTAPADPVADNLTLTALSAPLPREAFNAQISFAYRPPATLRAGEKRSIRLLVKNSSPVLWPYSGQPDTKFQLHMGNRWMDQSGATNEDARAPLSYDLRPGDTEEVAITVKAPQTPGEYTLEFDLVQEYVGWFRDFGSQPLQLKLAVE